MTESENVSENVSEPRAAHVDVRLGEKPRHTVVYVDGQLVPDVYSLAMYASAGDVTPARLVLNRLVPRCLRLRLTSTRRRAIPFT
jgi:hypothetical protein